MTADPGETPAHIEPRLRLYFDADALASNWQRLDRLSGPALAGAAVKADAYGIGIERALPVLLGAGCRNFFVAHWSEARDVMAYAAPWQIAVLLGPTSDAEAQFARDAGLRPVINSVEQAARWIRSGAGPCHLMVDTGMNRLGVRTEDLGDPTVAALDVDIIMSHLACADEDSAMNAAQQSKFASVLPLLRHRRASLANSAGIALGQHFHFDLTRPGLALYGGIPRGELAHVVQQVVAPEAAIIQIRTVPAGESVGYGASFTAPYDMRVAILALGYADGFLRSWSGVGGFSAQDGADLPVLGRVSMDLTAVDITAAPHLSEGDWLRADYALPMAAERSGLSQYELLTLSGQRLRRG